MEKWRRRVGLAGAIALAISRLLLPAQGQQKPAAAKQTSVDALMGTAQYQEEVEGKPEAAIATYKKVLSAPGVTRAQAARAHFRIGVCYENLGKAEARKEYDAVVRDFADQGELVKLAKERLAALTRSGGRGLSGPVARLVWSGDDADGSALPSPDGRYLATSTDPDLAIREVATGATKSLVPASKDEAILQCAWSPEGKRIAYTVVSAKRPSEVRVIGVDGSNPRLVQSFPDRDVELTDWSPDGRHLLVRTGDKQSNRIAAVALSDGSVRIITSLPQDRVPAAASCMRFSPDGRLIAYQQGKASDYADLDIYVVPTAGGQPTAILSDSFIDELAGWAPDGTGLVSISDREGAPGFWLVRVSDGKPAGKPRLLKAYVGPPGMITTLTRNGSLFYGTSGGRQDVWVATVDLISGRLLEGPTRIGRGTAQSSPAWSPDGKYLAYLSVMGMTSSPNTNFISTADTLSLLALETGQTRHFAVPIAMSLIYSIHWSSDGRSIVVAGVKRDVSQGGTPASWPGLYRIDAQTGEASPIGTYHGGGSAALSQDGKTLFYATGGPTGWGVFARDVKTGDEHVILKEDRRGSGSVAVSPDGKWLAVDSFPYANYGEYVLRILPADGGEARELYRAQMDFPFYSVAWSADSRHVLFAIAGPDRKRAYWYMPLAGGSPVRIDLAMPGMRLLSLHPDGRRIAFATRERRSDELWVLENFLPPAKPTPKTSARR